MLLAMPPLTAAQIMLSIDRYLGGHFFDTQAGGSAVLWMHFFWIFGHPEVYVLVMPAFAFVSEIIPVFSRKPIFGYPVMVAAIDRDRLHQPGRVGAPHVHGRHELGARTRFFAIATMAVGVPTGIKIFNWLARCGAARSSSRRRCCSASRFLFQFLIAGLTGIMLAVGAVRLAAQRLVLRRRAFPLRARRRHPLRALRRLYYWFPKVTGRMFSERLGQLHFWLFVIGFHLTFDLHAHPGTAGHAAAHLHLRAGPRLGDLEPDRHGRRALPGGGDPVFVWNLVRSLRRGRAAGQRSRGTPGRSNGSTTSPPPAYNFATIPVVSSRRPLWDLKHPDDPDWKYE